ncbi:MAG TPA: class I SAM-dependent methyltransferase [Gaiellaceae bacterium]|nr:class I SAM-dependent methyltransferase [Gaiellaceae bacterium]
MSGARAQTWHYGLVARWWAEFNVEGPEIEFFRPYLEAGQPALDAACGTGRLLVPYLHAGIDVDGSDISPDMLEHVRRRAALEGLRPPNLYAQAMHELDLPRRYGTILVCGGFGLGGVREHDVEGLRRIFEHLKPGGTFMLDNEVPYADAGLWSHWPRNGRAELPRPWREEGSRRTASDGTELELRSRLVALDPLDQYVVFEMRAAIVRDGERILEEEHELRMTLYFTHEIELMLAATGFVDVELRAGYEDRPPTGDDDFVVFVARKPGAAG